MRTLVIALCSTLAACAPAKPAQSQPEPLLETSDDGVDILEEDEFDARSNETTKMDADTDISLNDDERETHGDEDFERAGMSGIESIKHRSTSKKAEENDGDDEDKKKKKKPSE